MSAPTADEIAYYEAHASDNQQAKLYAAAISTTILCWLFIALRFVARWKIKAGFQSDDWLIVAAGLAFTCYPIGVFILLSVGFGRHIIFVTNSQLMVEVSSNISAFGNVLTLYRWWSCARSLMP